MFIERIRVQGYQSLYDVEVFLGGFTVIHGESDVGKSALFRSFRGLLQSEEGDAFISKGLGACKVALVMGTGDAVAWIKKKKTSGEYRLKTAEGKLRVFRRGRKLPQEISQILRFGSVVVDGITYFPNLRSQFDRLFLLFETPGKRARVLGSLISNILLKGIREANVLRNRNASDIRAIDSMTDELKKKQVVDWDGILTQIQNEKKILFRLDSYNSLYKSLQELVEKRDNLDILVGETIEEIEAIDWKRLGVFVDAYEELRELRSQECSLEGKIEWLTGEISESEKTEKEYQKSFRELKKSSMFPCPHCGKEISRLEIEDG